MSNMILSSSKTLIRATSSPIPSKPKIQIPQFSTSKFPAPKISPKPQQVFTFSSKTLKPLPLFAATALTHIPPSLTENLAAEKLKTELSDSNLTLPIKIKQILTLVFGLVKNIFSPLRKLKELEDRVDADIKSTWVEIGNMKQDFQEEVAEVREVVEKQLNKNDSLLRKLKNLEERIDADVKTACEETEAKWSKIRKKIQAEVAAIREEELIDDPLLGKLKELQERVDAELKTAWDETESKWTKMQKGIQAEVAEIWEGLDDVDDHPLVRKLKEWAKADDETAWDELQAEWNEFVMLWNTMPSSGHGDFYIASRPPEDSYLRSFLTTFTWCFGCIAAFLLPRNLDYIHALVRAMFFF